MVSSVDLSRIFNRFRGHHKLSPASLVVSSASRRKTDISLHYSIISCISAVILEDFFALVVSDKAHRFMPETADDRADDKRSDKRSHNKEK
jgi:hypothetical protein